MISEKNPEWNITAWNGISFEKPIDWEIATIGPNYLMLGTRFEPRLEISWKDIPASASQTRYREKLLSRIGQRRKASVDAWTPPCELSASVSAYDDSWFLCNTPSSRTYGCVLFCKSCHRISMIQMYLKRDEHHDPMEMCRMLASFSDHPQNDLRRWTVFDIQFTLPSHMNIHTYRFSTGYICLCFKGNRHVVTLHRWSPAQALLTGERSLTEFAVSRNLRPMNATETILNPYEIEFKTPPQSRFSIIQRLNCRLNIRHCARTNRIIAVKAESRRAIDTLLFEAMISQL